MFLKLKILMCSIGMFRLLTLDKKPAIQMSHIISQHGFKETEIQEQSIMS